MANLLGTLITGNLRTTQGYGTSDSTRILYPGGGSFVTTTSVITGAIRIKMPVFGSGMMMTCTVKVYEYSSNKSFTITFGGHRDSNNWYNIFCYFDGDGNRGDLTVRFGLDDGVNCVWIGETSNQWSYPQVFVTDVQLGYVGYSTTWLSGWSVGFVTSFGTVNRTATAFQKITTTNIGSQSVSFATSSGTFSTNWTNYKGVTENAVAGQLMWKNYGNNHTIFDASNSTSPTGSGVNNTNPDVAWTGTYPTLMGWNGNNTYGVRVDSARLADTAGSLTSMNISQFTNNSGYITGYTETDTLQSVTNRGASTSAQVSFTKTDDHAISVGTIRGRAVGTQGGEFIQLYERVNIGGPSGWGAANTGAPTYGLSVYGGANIGYGNNASLFSYAYRGNGNVGGTGEASWHPAGIYSGGTQWLYGTTYRNNATTSGQGQMYFDGNYGYGMVGLYASTRYQAVFAMGDAYKLPVDGTTTGSLYGLAWSHPNAGGVAGNLNTHGLLVMENGTFLAAISGSIRSRDDMRAPIFYDSADTAYYGDFAGTSNLNYLNLGNTREEFPLLRMGAAGRYALGVSGAYTRLSSHNAGIGVQLGSYDGTTFGARLTVGNDGNVEATTSLRAPIFYDSNNTAYYLDPNSSTSGYFAGTLRQNEGKYVRDSSYRTISGYSDYYSGGAAGWYRAAEIRLTSNCTGAVLYGTLYDHRYDGADAYQISVVARAECSFTSDNNQHYINVGCTITGSTAISNYRDKIRLVLVEASSNSRTYELQFYETNWNHDTWQLETTGWTVYSSPQAPRASVAGDAFVENINYISNQGADYQRANTAMYSPIYYDSQDTAYYVDPNGTSNLLKLSTQTMAYNGMNPMSANSDYVGRYNGSVGYRNGTMGIGNTDFNTIFSNWGSGFIDTWSSPANAPGGSTHYIGLQSIHYSELNSNTIYGFQMACAGEADNRFFWRSSWPGKRAWVEMIHSGTIGSQSVASAGNSDTVDGFHASVAGTANTIPTRNASGYLIPENWIQLNGIYGLYSPTNSAHLRPNDGSYGSWLVTGSRNGWRGLEFDSGTVGNVSLMVSINSNTVGFHNNSYGWQFYWEGGTLYCFKNTYGAGTQATVLDSVNYTNYAAAASGNTGNEFGARSFFFPVTNFNPSTAPRDGLSSMSVKMWNNYFNGTGLGSDYGTVMEYYSLSGHVDSQVYFDAGGGSWYRTAAYASGFGGWQQYITSANFTTWAQEKENQRLSTTNDVTHNSTTSPTFLVNNHSDNTKGYRIHNTSGSSVSAMFTNSSNQLVIAAGAVDQINLNKKVYVNAVALGVNVTPSGTAGRIDASNDIVAFSSSDERLKENITPIANALDKVKSLTGVEFDWKPEHKEAHGHAGHDTGIIAQQVLGVMPTAVRTNDTGYLAVRYEKLIGLLIEANKELAARVEELEKKIG